MSSQKVAIVTGSGKRRVGNTVAEKLAEAGYALVIHYHRSSSDAQQTVQTFHGKGWQAIALQADIRNDREVGDLVQAAVNEFGRIDVLVNCAAIYRPKLLQEVTAADVRENFEANLLGTFLCCQKAGLVMAGQTEGGAIINFGDWAAARPYLNYAAYFASKGAIPTLTRCLAVELGTRNPRVRVNCIMPGPVLFPPDMSAAEKSQAVGATLAKRPGSPEDVAKAVLFLVSDDFVTGVTLNVDGGRAIFAGE
jgi:pteridine reductase